MHSSESQPSDSESLLISIMKDGDSPNMRRALAIWKTDNEESANEIEDGPERGRARIELIIKEATLLLREAKLTENAINALDEAWQMAVNENREDLMEVIKGLYNEAGVGL